MKKIKRSISILLIAMMALAMLGGCGNNSTSGNSTANGDSAKATEKTADAGEAKGTESNPFILGVSPMSGWYAWYGVKDTGIFEQNGVYVDLQFFPVYSDSLTAFYSGQVDGICIAASDAVAPVNEGVDFKVVLVNDNSYGADGIVVQDGINSIEDLKGKTVAKMRGEDTGMLAYRFHQVLAEMITAACIKAKESSGRDKVALSGGVFQNRLLLRLTEERLLQEGFEVLRHRMIPPNDGGIAIGQAAYGMYQLQK